MPGEQRRIFSVVGTLPEPGGYAVAKFSRSARPYQEWIQELTQEGASRFYEQFYFAYGHASIADLAHLTMVAENISIVAAIEILDEQLVDAQESSTRYQDFTRRRFFTPPEIESSGLSDRYAEVCDRAFTAYHSLHRALVPYLERRYQSQRPDDLPDEEYRRTIRARAFDVARYLLPSSTYTGLGYLCSARTLERQISRLASHPLDELRGIADELKSAATGPAYNPLTAQAEPVIRALSTAGDSSANQQLIEQLRRATLAEAAAAPTLVRYTAARPYLTATLGSAQEAAERLLGDTLPDGMRGVTLVEPVDPTAEVAATLLYRASQCSYEQVLSALGALQQVEVEALANLAYAGRGPHDELVREARAGFQLTFDLCLDQGAFRDLHRHRNCIQIIKDFSSRYGYDLPAEVAAIGAEGDYERVMEEAGELSQQLDRLKPGLGQYALPLAYRRRALFKMDSAQLTYIVEQRTAPAGHFSYRDMAFRMYEAFAARFPALARHIRVADLNAESFFDR
ncbi:MAG: FAD-dependent thymidylate synthase [Chloroflexi bacterium]|nr:FAD-dependent thymidylate synthase [Chloroflexota bacterium]